MISSKKNILEYILYIHYLFCFYKTIGNIKTLIDASSRVNTMTPVYILKLGLNIRKTNIRARKIDISKLVIYRIVVVLF